MFIGHFAPALVAAAHPRAPRLGTLFIAAQLVDFAFFALVLAGVEKMQITPGTTVMNAMDFYYMPYTHSLAGGLLFGAIMAGIIFLSGRNVTAAFITGGVVLSHWFTDFLVHAPDLVGVGAVELSHDRNAARIGDDRRCVRILPNLSKGRNGDANASTIGGARCRFGRGAFRFANI
jgi:hypothetical protein